MKLRIIQAGMEKFTGDFGPVPFVDGVSTRDVTHIEAQRLAGLVAIETVEDTPRNPSISQVIIDTHCTSMNAEMLGTSQRMIKDPVRLHTREELMAIADKDGIEGLRPLGAALNVKHNSIQGLIERILKVQTPETKDLAPAPAVGTVAVTLPPEPAPAPAA